MSKRAIDLEHDKEMVLHKADMILDYENTNNDHDRQLFSFMEDTLQMIRDSLMDAREVISYMAEKKIKDSLLLKSVPFGNINITVMYQKDQRISPYGSVETPVFSLSYKQNDYHTYDFVCRDTRESMKEFATFIIDSGVTAETLKKTIEDFGNEALSQTLDAYNDVLDKKLMNYSSKDKAYMDVVNAFGDIKDFYEEEDEEYNNEDYYDDDDYERD